MQLQRAAYALDARASARNAAHERARLVEAFEAGTIATPRWSYARSDQRLRNALASEAGTGVVGALARARFRSANPAKAGEATILARKWINEGREGAAETSSGEVIMSDAAVPGSLLTRMREEVGRLCLPFAVVVQPSLAALAATGERHILVAANRPCTRDDVERTVMHEIEAHAIPRTRAALVKEHGLSVREAVLVAERAYRGGDGTTPGLGRERIYLEAFLRVGEHLAKKPTDEGILTSGQISLEAIPTIAPFVRRARATEPPPAAGLG